MTLETRHTRVLEVITTVTTCFRKAVDYRTHRFEKQVQEVRPHCF